MSQEDSCGGAKPLDLLNHLEHILESDPLINEVGFIHPSQFVALNKEDGIGKMKLSEANHSDTVFWNRDHKLGISTQVLLPLYHAAKHAFMAALERYKMAADLSVNDDGFKDENVSILESEVMKHSRSLLLLSCDFGTVWNSRKLILSDKQHVLIFMDELLLSSLVLSYAPKSERSWSHRRWVIKMIAGKCSNLEEIVEKESDLVKQIAEKSKMNYRAWNHRCWLVSYMSREQVMHELNKSRGWDGLHVADNSCFHYRTEELDWDEMLINRYIGREALWLHRRFLSLCWIKHFATNICEVSSHSDNRTTTSHDMDMFFDNELRLFRSCSIIPDNQFEDFQAHAIFSATYILWLKMQISEFLGIEFQEKLPAGEAKALLNKVCPEKSFLWSSLGGLCGRV